MTKYLKLYVRLLSWLLKIAAPINVVLFPSIVIYGAFSSWAPAEETIRNYAGETLIMVGASEETRRSDAEGHVQTYRSNQRSYLLFPSMFRDPKLVVIEKSNEEPTQIRETRSGFFFLLSWYLLCVLGTWWFWLRRQRVE